jgi:hydroxymethylpyrimidine/phosphomethylpyrimidine kinase
MRPPTALTVAGSDSGGGAGIQADLKTFLCRGVYGMSVITATTAQSTRGVTDVHLLPPAHVRAQLRAVLEDLPVDAIKIGMLGDAARIDAVADVLEALPVRPPVVLDPVMVAKGGAPLLDPDAVAALRARLLPLATLITPNLPEAEALGGLRGFVLRKGGHAEGALVEDALEHDGVRLRVWTHPRATTRDTHGTGCTLAACIAAELAKGATLESACGSAIGFVAELIARGPSAGRLGGGHGPLLHGLLPHP